MLTTPAVVIGSHSRREKVDFWDRKGKQKGRGHLCSRSLQKTLGSFLRNQMSILSGNVISPKEEVKTHPCARGHGTVDQSPYRQGSFQILHGTKSLAGDNQGLSGWHPVLSERVGVGAGGSQIDITRPTNGHPTIYHALRLISRCCVPQGMSCSSLRCPLLVFFLLKLSSGHR